MMGLCQRTIHVDPPGGRTYHFTETFRRATHMPQGHDPPIILCPTCADDLWAIIRKDPP